MSKANPLTHLLKGGDLRSIGKADEIANSIHSQKDFDLLFACLFNYDRLVVMRSADATEKVTKENNKYLQKHKNELLTLLCSADHIELKWHMAQLITRISLTEDEAGKVWEILTKQAKDTKESKIVRVLSMQGLFDILTQYPELKTDFLQTITLLEKEPIPSIAARIRILKKKLK